MANSYKINGIEYTVPMYVRRSSNASWGVFKPDGKSAFFADSKFGGTGAALKAALEFRNLVRPEEDPVFLPAERERSGKKEPLGVPGVFLVHQKRRGSRPPSVFLHCILKGVPARTIYVGTNKTWIARFPEKLALAITSRELQIKALQEQRTAKEIK